MEKISINNKGQQYGINSIWPVSLCVMQITFADKIPETWGDIYLYTSGGELATVLRGYDTLLDVNGQVVQVSCDDTAFPVDPPSTGPQTPYYEQLEQQIADVQKQNASMNLAMTFAAASFTDQQAVQVPTLYPLWSDLPDGTTLTMQEEASKGTEITRVRGDSGKLYKVIKTHAKQSDWAPGQATASLFTVIDVEHAGTMEDPIPAAVNMEYFRGKYYLEDGKIYICIRDSGKNGLQYLPSQLVGHYFEIIK